MADIASYDDDILAWSEQQAAALRRLAASGRPLPNELDLDHVAEEIEDLGRSELNAVRSFLGLIFLHLLKLAAEPEAAASRHWQEELIGFHRELLLRFSPAMRQRLDAAALWRRALRDDATLAALDGRPAVPFPPHPPFDVEVVLSDEADFDGLIRSLRPAAGEPS